MRKLILKMSVSIDGFVRGANGESDWIFRTGDDESKAWTVQSISRAGVHIMGSSTFKDMAAYWPSSTEVFAAPMNDIPKVVFSRKGRAGLEDGPSAKQLEQARANASSPPTTVNAEALASWTTARVASGPLAEEVARLKQETGGPIVAHGGASFAQSLIRENLVDEYQLLVHPVALGGGLPIFSALTQPLTLELAELKRFPRGTVAHIYRR
ncbi:MAG TPA: dihydrofolate reductase family protein [Kofleriaceae bacterium]|jgi:dihydrofolate reductase|nr:dihydrofolate reductase family protein [Kofleriaceae bacterium]